jgi:hypothetical protein
MFIYFVNQIFYFMILLLQNVCQLHFCDKLSAKKNTQVIFTKYHKVK